MRVYYYLSMTLILSSPFALSGKGARAGEAQAEDALSRGREQTIKIGSYNVENLWDGNRENTNEAWDDYLSSLPTTDRHGYPRSLQYDDYAGATSNWYSPAVLHAKIENVLTALKLMGQPEIVALQEVESAGNHSEVFDLEYSRGVTLRDKLEELGYRYFIVGEQEEGNPVAVTTAVISKLPIKARASVAINFGARSTSARDIQVVEAKVGNGRVLLFNSHWKSKRGNGEAQRIETAHALRPRIAPERQNDPLVDVIAVGDFNAAYDEEPLRALGSTGDERLMLGAATSRLYNFWYEMPAEGRWEHSFNGARATLSHMLVSDTLYDHAGLQYVDQSFVAVGQKGSAAKTLLGVNGHPYRWQVRKDRQTTYHVGKGFSDHLPLVATFRIFSDASPNRRKLDIAKPSQDNKGDEPRQVLFDEVDVCDGRTAIDISGIAAGELDDYEGQCVKISVPEGDDGLLLRTRGKYRATYVTLSGTSSDMQATAARLEVGLTMTREFDWRPNIDDSRVSLADASLEEGRFSAYRFHPHSNKCFVRKVLQGPGGRLRYAVGRLGYSEGFLNLHVASREAHHLRLEDLPSQKATSCSW